MSQKIMCVGGTLHGMVTDTPPRDRFQLPRMRSQGYAGEPVSDEVPEDILIGDRDIYAVRKMNFPDLGVARVLITDEEYNKGISAIPLPLQLQIARTWFGVDAVNRWLAEIEKKESKR